MGMDPQIPAYELNDGTTLPAVGFGTYPLRGEDGVTAMVAALANGYRLLDSAVNYGNEAEVGEALRRSGLPRDEVRLTTKIPGRHHAHDLAIRSLRDSAAALRVERIDLALIHWPNPSQDLYAQAWQALVDARRDGLVESIGVSNFTEPQLRRVIDETGVVPAVNQIELHPYFPQVAMRAVHDELGIRTEAWSPLGKGSAPYAEPPVADAARTHGVTPAQVILRWHVQLGSLPLPKSAHPERQRANLDVFGFDLTQARDGGHHRAGPPGRAAVRWRPGRPRGDVTDSLRRRGRGRAFVGVSGWRYPRWRGDFYPAGLRQRDELAYVAARMTSVEVNGSFYSLMRPSTYAGWRAAVPAGFVLAVKGARFITHFRRLVGTETALANFFASGVLALGPGLGPLLWQLPERVPFDREVISQFVALLPRTTDEAASLAARHGPALAADRVLTSTEASGPVRHALEPRHPSFDSSEARRLLQDNGIALVHADTAGRFPAMGDDGSVGFRYVRLHGEERLYGGGYAAGTLQRWAGRMRGWLDAGDDVYAYLDNDADGRAPFDAVTLLGLLGS